VRDDLRDWLAEAGDSDAVAALAVLVDGVTALVPEPTCDIGTYGARFYLGRGVLCEVSVFGALFIVRVGPQQSVEYRVRDLPTALEALDHVVRQHLVAAAVSSTA
jgi:hypothetical protein